MDFAFVLEARHVIRPKRVRHPTAWPFVSSCSPPLLSKTQLLSTTRTLAIPDKDFHPANCLPSQAHSTALRAVFACDVAKR